MTAQIVEELELPLVAPDALASRRTQSMAQYEQAYAVMPDENEGEHFRYCPGCGLGIAQSGILRAYARLQLDPSKTVTLGGSGCYSLMGHYIKSHHSHGGHGRACAVATGVKMANPELTVITLQGDGDSLAIGAPHFVHAARRNIDITVILFNNFGYGDTGMQYGPTTPKGSITETSPYGMPENNFDVINLALGAGAGYAARTTVYHSNHLVRCVEAAIRFKGFSVVEILQNCHELWGKRNGMPTAAEMLKWYAGNSVMQNVAETMEPEDLVGKFILGQWWGQRRPEMTEEWQATVAKAQEAASAN